MMKLKPFILVLSALCSILQMSAVNDKASDVRSLRKTEEKGVLPSFSSKVSEAKQNSSYSSVLIGNLIYADSWNNLPDGTITPFGIYTFDTSTSTSWEPYARIGKFNARANGGAVLVDNKFYWIFRQTDPTGSSDIDISQLFCYDTKTGETLNMGEVSSELVSVCGNTWDPVENKIYGTFSSSGSYTLGIIDYEAQSVTSVGQCLNYYAIACDAKGQLYGIDEAGDLYKIDKKTAKADRVGATGVKPRQRQSMAFDHKSGDLFWASYDTQYNSVLYKVDVLTAKLTTVRQFNDEEEIIGLGVLPATFSDFAPGFPTNLQTKVEGDSRDVEVSFTAPEYQYYGTKLEGKLNYTISANDNVVKSGETTPGANLKVKVKLPEGEVKVAVACSNSEGAGPASTKEIWIGQDNPASPENAVFTLDKESRKASLTWNPVTVGAHNGFIEPANITYEVIRMPENKQVAKDLKECSFSEVIDMPDIPVSVYYQVKAYNGWRESEPVSSNKLLIGKGYDLPYHNDFATRSSMDAFVVIDGNNDGSTWKWNTYGSKTAYIFTGTEGEKAQDDWLITPGLKMKKDNAYKLTVTIKSNMGGAKFQEIMEIGFGDDNTSDAMKTVKEAFSFDGSGDKTVQVTVTPEQDGYYYFGFHAMSDSHFGLSISLDDLYVQPTSNPQGPAAVQNLTVTTDNGTPPVKISFTAPTNKNNGEKLTQIDKIDVYCNNTVLVKSIENPIPGKSYEVIDNKGASGLTTYTITAQCDGLTGESLNHEVYLGLDAPGRCYDITLTDKYDDSLELTWTKPTEGENGGWYDENNISYNVYSVSGSTPTLVASNVKTTSYTISNIGNYGSQKYVTYAVSASNKSKEGKILTSNEVIIGTPYNAPFAESFKNGEPSTLFGVARSGESRFNVITEDSSDKDGGCLEFNTIASGDMSYAVFGKVGIFNMSSPKLIFDYKGQQADASFKIEINKAYAGYDNVATIDFNTADNNNEWKEYVVDLARYAHLPYITVRILATSHTPGAHILLDNIRIENSNKPASGIEVIYPEYAEPQYYNLTGVRVYKPSKGAIYIVRYGDGRVEKIMF